MGQSQRRLEIKSALLGLREKIAEDPIQSQEEIAVITMMGDNRHSVSTSQRFPVGDCSLGRSNVTYVGYVVDSFRPFS